MDKIKIGVLGTAQIGMRQVIPAIQKSESCEVAAIASRTAEKAKEAAQKLNIDKFYGLYENLLQDDELDAVYIPLPNHLHVPWSIKALQAGKHVLCEKPLALNAGEVQELQKVKNSTPDLKCMEAFMYRFHPQWDVVRKIINTEQIGKVQAIHSTFTYFNDDADNIRNKYIEGGGGLMDIGCYCINLSRFLFNSEPERVIGNLRYDPEYGIDIQANGILDFGNQSANFMCATRQFDDQEAVIKGSEGIIRVANPFTQNQNTAIELETATGRETIDIEPANQFTIQADEFARSIIDSTPQPYALDDAYKNMKVIDALFESDKHDKWVPIAYE
jgi:predicted dehydrogenase